MTGETIAPDAAARRKRRLLGPWWSLEERGFSLGMRFVLACHRLIGQRFIEIVLWPISSCYYFTAGGRRRAILTYLDRVEGRRLGFFARHGKGLRLFLNFASKMLDTVVSRMDPGIFRPIKLMPEPSFTGALEAGQGGMLIVAHLGNPFLSRAVLPERYRFMNNILVHTRHAVKYNRVVEEAGEEVLSRRVQVGDIGPEVAVDLMDRIANGEWLSIAGDRAAMSGPARQCRVPFLGYEAAFSQGPYILAALLKCPVYLFFCLKEDTGYAVYVEKFADRIALPHRNRPQALAQYAARYAQALERYCRMAETQWYNFYDYWA